MRPLTKNIYKVEFKPELVMSAVGVNTNLIQKIILAIKLIHDLKNLIRSDFK